MKKEIKIIAVLLSVLLLFCLCGCKKGSTDNNSSTFSSVPSEAHNPSLETETSSEEESIPSSSVEQETVSSQPPSEPDPVVSTPVPDTTPSVPSSAQDYITVGTYTVYDPYNTRGLSEVRNGYSFGVASGGKPHSISVTNQQKFDAMQNVDALALDTVSEDKRMYLTFDCGYEYNNLTASILDTLKEKDVKAAFFCTLDYIEDNPQLVRRMIDEGHIVGNHSANHPDFSKISRAKMAEEIYLVDKYLKDNFGYTSNYFRFPSGAHSENALELVTSIGQKSIFWSVAYADWETANQPPLEQAFNTVTSRYHSGAVILLHAVSATNDAILGRLIDHALSEEYIFKTLDDYAGYGLE